MNRRTKQHEIVKEVTERFITIGNSQVFRPNYVSSEDWYLFWSGDLRYAMGPTCSDLVDFADDCIAVLCSTVVTRPSYVTSDAWLLYWRSIMKQTRNYFRAGNKINGREEIDKHGARMESYRS